MSEIRQIRVNEWNGSLGIRFPADFVDFIQLKDKSLVEIQTDGDRLIITKVKETPKKYSIKELFEMYPSDCIEEELDWGNPIGDEVW